MNSEDIDAIVARCDAEARMALGMVPAGTGPVAAHYRGYARAVIEAYRASLQEAEGNRFDAPADEIEKLRAALEPFLTIRREYFFPDSFKGNEGSVIIRAQSGDSISISLSDIERARSVLGGESET